MNWIMAQKHPQSTPYAVERRMDVEALKNPKLLKKKQCAFKLHKIGCVKEFFV